MKASDSLSLDEREDIQSLNKARVESSKDRIAKALNLLETTSQELKWACEDEEWNDDVVLQIDDAAKSLGYALATLVRWFSEDSRTDSLKSC